MDDLSTEEHMGSGDHNTVKEFLNSNFVINNPISVTLTSRQSDCGLTLDEISLQRDITFFLNRLNYKVFKKRFSRFGKKLGVLSVIEGDRKTPFHCHLTLELPDEIPIDQMKSLIKHCWGGTKFGRTNDQFGIKVEPVIDEGWMNYQLKKRTKRDGVISSIDWINSTSSVTE